MHFIKKIHKMQDIQPFRTFIKIQKKQLYINWVVCWIPNGVSPDEISPDWASTDGISSCALSTDGK